MLNPDYRDILSELSGAGADFLVVGAFAMAAHQMPRATGDLDIWIRPDAPNARRVWTALARFGAPVADITWHLLVNKRAAGRPKDLADAAWIEEQGT